MHRITFAGLCLLALWLGAPGSGLAQIQLQGQFSACNLDTVRLFVLDGISLRQVAKIPLQRQETQAVFVAQLSQIPKGFYFLGGGQAHNTRMLILGSEASVLLRGSCDKLAQAQVLGSSENQQFQQLMQQYDAWQKKYSQLIRQAQASPDKAPFHQQLATQDSLKKGLLDSLQLHHPFLAKIAALRTYLSYVHHGEGYGSENEYFARTYFRFADLSDPTYLHMPLLHESFKNYAYNLGQMNFPEKDLQQYAQAWLDSLPQRSSGHKAAVLGLVAGFQHQQIDAYIHFAELYLNLFPQDNPPFARQLRKEMKQVAHRQIGALAADFALADPSGDTLRLSDYRGKVVLIDFWASWCGPCRRENPKVRALYDRYHQQGFEILGVSLDRSASAWVKAIAEDKLEWPHVWDQQKVASRLYGARLIPHTVLVDRNGRVRATKLRGAALERALANLLAESSE